MDAALQDEQAAPFWTPLRDSRAERLWRAGWPARAIAQRLGAASDSAVRGRALRRGWRRPAAVACLNHQAAHPPFDAPRFALPPDPPAALAVAPRPWLTRRAGECAFPVDGEGPDLRSCCNPAPTGPYCPAHAAVMRGPRAADGESLFRALSGTIG